MTHQAVSRRRSLRLLVLALMMAAPAPAAGADEQPKDAAAQAPVKRIVLFSSGVGYFEHQGQVAGDATIDLQFDVDDVNDLLKSMVLEDRGGGQISTVTYGSRDPITKTLGTFAIDLTQRPTLGQLLDQIRGERVVLDAPTKIEGVIVGVEKKQQAVPEAGMVEIELLTLLTEEGLRRVPLDSIGRIKLANDALDKELRQALKILASGHAADKKKVSLEFLGEGERDVRIGYIQEAPVWKTSYRLVLDDEGKPLLQGWAIVENTTDADWRDVRLSLVSGRPISFTMDLYSPLYAERPVVVPELYSSLRPQVYEQNLSGGDPFARRKAPGFPKGSRYDSDAAAPASAMGALEDGSAAASLASAVGAGGNMGGVPSLGRSMQETVQAAAQGGDVGELFQYDIKNEVTLARQSSAMLPIINDKIEGRKVSIYSPAAHAKHPMNGVELKNTSELHLMQGPATVFDGGVYAGDARLPDVPPGSERLLSYALDLAVEVAPTSDAKPQQLTSARLAKGVLIATYKHTRTHSYKLKNSGDAAKTVLVEHPIEGQWKLVAPKEPTEKTRDKYRFAVETPARESAELKIEEQQTIRQQAAIAGFDAAAIQVYLSAEEISDAVKDALREVARRQGELAELRGRKGQLEGEVSTIEQEQSRIRENMRSIDRNTDLYNRYVKKFTDQEDRIEVLREEVRELDEQIKQAEQSLAEYVAELDLT